MLFVPFTVPTFPATHHQTTHPAHQSHHQQLQANTQNPVQQPQQLNQLNQLSHLNHQGIVPATTNQPTIHSTSCSPQQQATTPNKVRETASLYTRRTFARYKDSPKRCSHVSRNLITNSNLWTTVRTACHLRTCVLSQICLISH